MSVLSAFKKLFVKRREHYVNWVIPKGHQGPPIEGDSIKAEHHYVRIWLAEMFLANQRKLFSVYEPVVHSTVALRFGAFTSTAPNTEFSTVVGKVRLPNFDGALGRSIVVNQPLTGLLPFRGGIIEVAAGLVSYRTKDYLHDLLGVMEDLSGMLMVPQLSAALPVASIVAEGVEKLASTGDKDIHLLYAEAFSDAAGAGSRPVGPGYIALVRATANQLKAEQLFVKDGRLHSGSSLASAERLEGFDYMLLRIEVRDERDDWASFETFIRPLDAAVEAQVTGDHDKAKALLLSAKIAAYNSADLTRLDAVRVVAAIQKEYEVRVAGVTPHVSVAQRGSHSRSFDTVMRTHAPPISEVGPHALTDEGYFATMARDLSA